MSTSKHCGERYSYIFLFIKMLTAESEPCPDDFFKMLKDNFQEKNQNILHFVTRKMAEETNRNYI